MHMFFEEDKIRSGDRDAFKNFFRYYYPRLLAFACRFVAEPQAKDLVQDLFAAIWEKRATLDIKNCDAYLFRSIRNKCLNQLKHDQLVSEHETRILMAQSRANQLFSEGHTAEVFRKLSARDIRQHLENSISKLSPRCAEAFRLCYFYDLPHKKIAEIMNISVRTVETHIRQAICHLRTDLTPMPAVFYEVFNN